MNWSRQGVVRHRHNDYSVLMTNNHFKSAAHTLATAAENAGYPLSAYAVLNIADALIAMGANFTEPAPQAMFGHEAYVLAALASAEVMFFVQEGKKINAIKELRQITGCGLKEAKEAVEDRRVWNKYNL